MINIKTYKSTRKNNSGGGGGGSSQTIINNYTDNTKLDEWFYFDADQNAVGCKYDFFSVGGITALAGTTTQQNLNTLSAEQYDKLTALLDKITVQQNNDVTIDATISQQQTP